MKKLWKSPTAMGAALVCASFAFMTIGCKTDVKDTPDENGPAVVDSSAGEGKLMSIGGGLFSIPSPIQTSLLIESSGAEYDKNVLNDVGNMKNYATSFQKAINLGIYGADVGYVTIYDQSQDALKYMTAIRRLSDDLGISGAFDQATIERFEKNFGVRDSMLNLVSVAYRNSDAFLKDNDRLNVGALILAGGWLETVYFSTMIAQKGANQELINRIGEQKYTLENIVRMLQPYAGEPEYEDLLNDFIDLAYDFDAVTVEYTYEKPTTDVDAKTTTINSTSNVVITEEHLNTISTKVQDIRNKLIGAES